MCKDVSMKDDVFAVIADPTRRHILQALAVERLAVGELVEELGVSQPTVSKHLKVLRTAGLVETEAVGQKRFYSITPTPLTTVTAWAEGLLAAPALEELQAEEAGESSTATQSAPEQQDKASAPAVDVPHPNTAGITFTPLTPFTPVLENRVADEGDLVAEVEQGIVDQQDAVSEQVRQLAQNLSLDAKDEGPISFKVPTPEQVMAQETALKAVAAQENRKSLVSQVQAVETVEAEAAEVEPTAAEAEHEDSLAAARQVVADAEARAKASEDQAHGQTDEGASDERGLLAKLTRWGRRSSR